MAQENQANLATQASQIVNVNEPPKQNPIVSFLPIVLIFFIFYFFILRPQQKKLKQDNAMRSAVKIGDKVTTTAGIIGIIREINEEKGVISLEVSKGVNILMFKSTIASVITEK